MCVCVCVPGDGTLHPTTAGDHLLRTLCLACAGVNHNQSLPRRPTKDHHQIPD